MLCRAGEAPDRIWVITGGLVHWLVPTADGVGELVARMRKGDVIGAQDVITGEERLATVMASIPTSTLELGGEDLIELARRYPQILINLVRLQRERLFRANTRSAAEERGEEIALVTGPSLVGAVNRIIAAARSATPRPVTFLDRRLSFAGALTAADDLVSEHATVLIPGELEPETLVPLLEEVDRVVALAGSPGEVQRLGRLAGAANLSRLEVMLVGEEALAASRDWPADFTPRVVRTCPREAAGFPLADADLAWLARHLTRTKLGLVLGAGGCKGYAHVGALQVLEEAGYTVDYVGGSSIGGFVSSHIALGHAATAIEARFKAAFSPENVAALFSSPFGAGTKGADALAQLLKDATEMRSFADTVIPLVVMAVDLTDRAPAPLREGSLWEALHAALAVAGVFPPHERDGHLFVDGIALVPVPTASVIEDGADLVVSVNLMGPETLERWPAGPAVEEAPPKRRRNNLDTLLEVMDLSQLDTSTRNAALADVVITPRFGPNDWRDFHLADLFLAAGRAAALEQLESLRALSRPVDLESAREGEKFARSDSLIL
jgi:NTE family protein